ncbi:hypothetical protein VTK73DRAFT_5612 [Phialemonium thermophilum]|uniref:Uncharacterized protein n=1 Tax=Phialemonium thermophilum TaxID=223376 RepID=A0ABR3V137_9PEZI
MVLQKLMELEASAAAAAEREDEEEQYFIWREDGPVGEAKCAVVESDDELRLTVPHFGTIGIARRASAMAARFVSGLAHPLPPDWCSASLAAPPLSMPSQTPLAGTPLVVQPIVRKPATDVVGLDGVFQDFYMDNNGGTTMWTSSPENRVAHGDHDPQHWRDDTMLGESCAFYGRPHPGSYSRDLV